MATLAPPTAIAPPTDVGSRRTLADLLHDLGDIPPGRVRQYPPPGTVTFEQFVEANERFSPPCEWVDGTLVEKAIGQRESWVTFLIIGVLCDYMDEHDPGMFLGPDGLLQILPELARAPDISFLSWGSLPGGRPPDRTDKVPALVPDLVVEVLSESNTRREMARKRGEYFRAKVKLVWEIDPGTRAANVYTGPDQGTPVPPDGDLDGGAVLPGFRLSLRAVFDRAERIRRD